MKKRILVLILVIALFMTCVPVAVSAAAEPTLTLSPDTSRTIVAGQTGKVVFTIQTLYTNERYNVIIYNAGGKEVAKVSSPYQNLSSGNIYRSVNINTQNLGMGVGTYTVKCYLEYYAQGAYQRASETYSYSLQVVSDVCDDEHNFIYDGIYRETTCKTAGLADYVCSDCGYRKFVSIPMDHNYDSGVCTLPATADSEGIVTYTCRTCGSTKEESFSKAAPTVTLKGLTATGKNKLTWNALEGADRYYVYYATAQEGPMHC